MPHIGHWRYDPAADEVRWDTGMAAVLASPSAARRGEAAAALAVAALEAWVTDQRGGGEAADDLALLVLGA